ncbi:hypothetical protein, partial [Escherichia coli]|uniref:hypothetical protein n=1 Tax=Escherichia coli TaxID=562 RepID=UPI00208DC09D
FDETPPAVRPAARPLAAGTLDEGRDVGAVALHGTREVLAGKAAHALRVATRRVHEAHPARVGPAPDRA